jgi:hypothetical protein
MRYFTVLLLYALIMASCKKNLHAETDITSLQELFVWNNAPFNSFTDLIKYNNNYYCAFREGDSHTSYNGKIRILTSTNGSDWGSLCLLEIKDKDLRDPHFFVDSDNILSIGISGRNTSIRKSYIYKFQSGSFVNSGELVADDIYYLWSFSKFNGSVFSIGYNIQQPCYSSLNSTDLKICLFKNVDRSCKQYNRISAHDWITDSFVCPSEASMVFTPDSNLITIVRDLEGLGYSHLGISKYPFTKWVWKKFPYYVRGPKLALLPDGRLFLAGASMIDLYKTYYAIVNPKHDYEVETIKVFPSYGDSGYPGVIIEGNTAWVSYYSSHEGNARIYIDRLTY